MHNLIPHFIQENFAEGVYRGEFSAASLFLDISGFTNMTEALMKYGPHGAEVLATIMRRVLEAPIRYVYEQGGFITGLAGDAFTALFPHGEGQKDGCWAALATAWQIQEYLRQNNLYASPYGEFTITAKAGLASGLVSWGILTSKDSRRAVYYFRGKAIDGCAEAEHRAKAGEIILDPEFCTHTRAQISVEELTGYYRLSGVGDELPPPQEILLPQADLEIHSRFYPKELLTQAYTGEFRQVVNLFINLPTVHTEAQLDIFMQSMFALQDQYGGLLNRLDFGDKGSNLLLFWGAPVAYENDIERALNFMLDLQTRTSLPIHAGVTYRIAHAGFAGSTLRDEYTCHGRGVNLAARFMTSASRGEIWVDEWIAQRAKAQFEIDFEAEMPFKGFAEKQRVYILFERKEKTAAIYSGVMVGRQAELDQLADFVAPLWQGQYAGVLILRGEAGIGKSRLVHEFEASSIFKDKEALWVLCQTDEILRESLNPFRYWLQRYFGQSEMLAEARSKRSFNHKLDSLIETTAQMDAHLAGELDRTRSFLGALIGLRWPDSLYEQLDPPGRYENTLIALSALLKAESLQQPLILFLEDAQWMDEDSKAYLPHLERSLTSDTDRSYPLAMIVTSRGEQFDFQWSVGFSPKEISLAGISERHLAQLAEAQLDGPAAPELLQLLAERAEGNPFFTEQILRYLQEEGLLVQDQNRWRVSETNRQSPLPRDVHALLVARLDRLAQQVKQVVQTAAILGREFEIQLLSRLLHDDPELPQKVSSAEQAAIWISLSELRYLFKHGLLLEAAYRMQVHAQRQALHALAAQALESLYAADLSTHYGELAYHCEQAELNEEARRYLQLAGEIAQEAYQNNQAIDYYSRALRLTPENDLEARYKLTLGREKVYDLLGDREAQHADLEALKQVVKAMDPGTAEAEVEVRWAEYALNTGDYLQAAAAAEMAAISAKSSATQDVAVSAHLVWSNSVRRQGRYSEAIHQAEQALNLARQASDLRGQSRALNILGMILVELNDLTVARGYYEQSLLLARKAGNTRIEAMVTNNLGNLAGALGEFSAARKYYQEALQLAREIGDRNGEGTCLTNLGWVVGTLGDYSAARSYCEQSLRIARETGDPQAETVTQINLSTYARRQGDLQSALSYAEQGLSGAQESGDRSNDAWAQFYLGHAYFELEQLEDAEQAYQGSYEIRRSLKQPNLESEPLAGLAKTALASGDPPQAEKYVQSILAYLDQGGTLAGAEEPLRVYLTCYQVLRSTHNPSADSLLESAYLILQEQAARIEDESMRLSFLEKVPHHREILASWEGHNGADESTTGQIPTA